MGIFGKILSLFRVQSTKGIKIADLERELLLLQQNKTEFHFIGILSNQVDCLYFYRDNSLFQIEYEAMVEEQDLYLDKLKQFAHQNGYDTMMSSYENKSDYGKSVVPVLRILTHSNLEKTAELGRKIQKEIFNNNENIEYEIVP